MNIEQVAAQLDRLAQAEQKLSSSRIVSPNGQQQQINVHPSFLAIALINLHIRLRNAELHLGIIERAQEAPPAGEEKIQ